MKYQSKSEKRLEILKETKELLHEEITKVSNFSDNQALLNVWNNLLRLEAWN